MEGVSTELSLVGVSFRSAPLPQLEKLALDPEARRELSQRVAEQADGAASMILSTCNRTEIYASTSDTDIVVSALESVVGRSRMPARETFYSARDGDCVDHLFRVSCGLESMILGEPQILGQVKEAYQERCDEGPLPPHLDRVIQAALRAGSKARASTDICRGAVSVASAAVHLMSKIYADISKLRVLILGAGETGRLLAEHFTRFRPKHMVIANRTLSRAEELAATHDARAISLQDLTAALCEADVVASAVHTETPIITRAMVEQAIGHHRKTALSLVDLGLPRNIAPAANQLPDVFVHDLGALEKVVDANLARRRESIPSVEAIIGQELESLRRRDRELRATPVVTQFREAIERIRKAEVERTAKTLRESERDAVEKATRSVVNKLLHGPTLYLKEYVDQIEEGEKAVELIRKLFGNLGFDDEDEK